MLSNIFLPEFVNPLDENLFNNMEQTTTGIMDFWFEEWVRGAKIYHENLIWLKLSCKE
jgi:hypothetical protein